MKQIKVEDLQLIVNYLTSRPYVEVYKLIAILAQLQDAPKIEEKLKK